MKKLLLLLVPLLLLVGCASEPEPDVVVGLIEVCDVQTRDQKTVTYYGQDCFRPTWVDDPRYDGTQATWIYGVNKVEGPPAWVENTRWEITVRTSEGTTYTTTKSYFSGAAPVIGQTWP